MLTLTDVSKSFGGIQALKGVTVEVEPATICGLIGPNGSGKSTLFNVISGLVSADSGRVEMGGRDITGWQPAAVAGLGVGRAFQIVRPLGGLTCLDNLLPGMLYGSDPLDLPTARRRAVELLGGGGGARPPPKGAPQQVAANLTLWQKKALEVARAVSVGRQVLLLDEVFAGLSPADVDRMVPIIRRLRDELDATILLVEHVMRATMALCDRIVVLSFGEIIADGTPQQIVENPAVIEVYLGSRRPGGPHAAR
jgi:ABC-type branched-subunit amino acid transport system ATPase component